MNLKYWTGALLKVRWERDLAFRKKEKKELGPKKLFT